MSTAPAAPAVPWRRRRQAVTSLRELVNPTARQQEFLEMLRNHQYVLYGGAAGGGKSYVLRWALVGLLLKWAKAGHRGVRVGLFCEDYPTLRDRHITRIEYEFPWWLGRLHKTESEFRLHPRWGGGVLALRNLNDPSKYLSSEFAAIAVDELSRNPAGTFDRLRMRLRWPGIDRTYFLGATNPGGIGHTEVKSLWIDGVLPPELRERAPLFAFVQARAADNPYLSPTYLEELASLPEDLRRAYLEGDWNVFEGQFFKQWRGDVHTCLPFPLPVTWRTRYVVVDFGYGAPWCGTFFARDDDLWATQRIARWYAYREHYGAGVLDRDQARLLLASVQADRAANPDVLHVVYGDPAMHAKKPMQTVSVADVYAQEGVPLLPAANERVLGWQRVRQYLAPQADGTPAVLYFTTCRNAIRTIPALVYDAHNVEDVDTDGEDHAGDVLRYFCMAAGALDIRPPEVPSVTTYTQTGAGPRIERPGALAQLFGRRG